MDHFLRILLDQTVNGLVIGNIYTYYGNQPFEVFGFPLWMAATNSLVPVVIGFRTEDMVPEPGNSSAIRRGAAASGYQRGSRIPHPTDVLAFWRRYSA